MDAIANGSAIERLVGQSPAIVRIRAHIRQIAASPVPVLILGETGTGKELCAAAIAQLSRRKPYVAVNCATFPESLADSELFGYERGAFTGAYRDHAGLVGMVDGGILFLDELAEMSLTVQAKLLRTLESGEYRKVGATKTRRSEFRLLAATNGDPDELMVSGKLRADLVYRLGAIRILLPPLRQRLDDIPLLADDFLRRYRKCNRAGPIGIAPAARRILTEYQWPGNIRELRNVVEAAAAFAGKADEIGVSDVRRALPASGSGNSVDDRILTLAEALDEAEAQAILAALQRSQNNRAFAARLLGISQATLYRKLAKHSQSSDRTRPETTTANW